MATIQQRILRAEVPFIVINDLRIYLEKVGDTVDLLATDFGGNPIRTIDEIQNSQTLINLINSGKATLLDGDGYKLSTVDLQNLRPDLTEIEMGGGGVGGTGESGLSGLSGLSGGSGTSGKSGLSGLSGKSGEKGVDGIVGSDGKSGLSGQSGLSGRTGSTILSLRNIWFHI
jgi:hypothetical protein